jgi:CO dehydrogenase maturation factor
MQALAGKLHIRVGRARLIVNRVTSRSDQAGPDDLPPAVRQAIDARGLDMIGLVPRDDRVVEYDAQGRPLFDLPPEATARRAVFAICAELTELKRPGDLR